MFDVTVIINIKNKIMSSQYNHARVPVSTVHIVQINVTPNFEPIICYYSADHTAPLTACQEPKANGTERDSKEYQRA